MPSVSGTQCDRTGCQLCKLATRQSRLLSSLYGTPVHPHSIRACKSDQFSWVNGLNYRRGFRTSLSTPPAVVWGVGANASKPEEHGSLRGSSRIFFEWATNISMTRVKSVFMLSGCGNRNQSCCVNPDCFTAQSNRQDGNFSSRRRHTRLPLVSWARRCV